MSHHAGDVRIVPKLVEAQSFERQINEKERQNMKRFLPIVLLSALAGLSGCAAMHTPAGSTPAYHDAVVAEHSFTTALASFQQAEQAEFALGHLSAAEHQTLEAGILKAAQAAQVLVSALQAGAANTTLSADFNTLASSVTDLINNGVLGIKNPASQAALKAALTVAQSVLNDIASIINQTATAPARSPAPPVAPKKGAAQ